MNNVELNNNEVEVEVEMLSEVTVEKSEVVKSKRQLSQDIFDKYYGKLQRKDILELLVNRAGCTYQGASTYYQDMKSGNRPSKRTNGESKRAKCQVIFNEHFGVKQRKDILELFVEAGCTHQGASTYYQNMKKKAEGK